MKRTLPTIFCMGLLALTACESVNEPTQVPLPTIIFVDSGSPTPPLVPSPILTLTVQLPSSTSATTVPPSTLIPTYTPTVPPTVTPLPTERGTSSSE